MAVDNQITVGEDAAVVYKAILRSKRIVITDNCAYHYRQREDSMLKLSCNYDEEYRRLKALNDCMVTSFQNEAGEYNLDQQQKEFITGTYIIRSGGKIDNASNELKYFPFKHDIVGKKVVVHGAGTFGQQLVRRIKCENLCELIGWIDKDFWEYRRCCMDVDPIERVCKLDFDYIIIALLAPPTIDCIKQRLIDYGVSESKIITVEVTKDLIDKAYNQYLLNS